MYLLYFYLFLFLLHFICNFFSLLPYRRYWNFIVSVLQFLRSGFAIEVQVFSHHVCLFFLSLMFNVFPPFIFLSHFCFSHLHLCICFPPEAHTSDLPWMWKRKQCHFADQAVALVCCWQDYLGTCFLKRKNESGKIVYKISCIHYYYYYFLIRGDLFWTHHENRASHK